jgi:predicted nucleic acid-binding protein
MELLIDEEFLCVASVVKAELLRGAASDHERSDIDAYWQNLPLIEASDSIWDNAGQLAYRLRRKGITPGLIDCYLASLAIRHDVSLMTLDKGFESIQEHCSLRLEPYQ